MTSKPLAFIIEDDQQLNQLFGLTLKADFDIVQIYDGSEALSNLGQQTPALIVLDMNLPGVPGPKILEYVRAEARFSHTRVILATADALQADALSDQADIVLLKPVSPAQLKDLAKRILPQS
ncbi:MAG: response regulator [Anaerolineales bacterium]|nr:response regulator [Anaerolineales bacterium]MCX7755211.1 response regulator [Anaerolineales bacterium]MDW8277484.1 response regulator [Anaerolineales bacterium]